MLRQTVQLMLPINGKCADVVARAVDQLGKAVSSRKNMRVGQLCEAVSWHSGCLSTAGPWYVCERRLGVPLGLRAGGCRAHSADVC